MEHGCEIHGRKNMYLCPNSFNSNRPDAHVQVGAINSGLYSDIEVSKVT